MADAAALSAPNPIDLHVGARVRMRRKFLGVSQERLADALGLTFQQVQKYERGANRISRFQAVRDRRFLEAPVAYFFEGLPAEVEDQEFSESESEQSLHGFLMTPEGIELASLFPQADRAKQRRRILELVRTLADDDGTE